MKKIAIILALLVNSIFVVFAQTPESKPKADNNDNVQKYLLDQLKAEEAKSKQLQSEKERLNNEIKELRGKNDELSTKLETAQKDLQEERNAGKAASFKTEIAKLKKQRDSLTQSNARALSDQQAKAVSAQNVLKQEIESLKKQHSRDSLSIMDLTKELKSLNEFKALWLAQLADGVDTKWLSKSYSAIDLSELELEYTQYEQFAEWDPKVADARDKIKILLGEMRDYTEGQRLIASKYDKKRIEETAKKLKELAVKTKDQTRKEELEALCKTLNYYAPTIEIFQDVIKSIDEQIATASTHNAAWPLVEVTIEEKTKDDSIAAIKDIPWLAEQYELYYKTLSENCLRDNPTRELIMSLQP